MTLPSSPHRPVRSFVRRLGRFTEGQRRAFERHWTQYGIDNSDAPLDFVQLFGRDAPTVVEIGFGNGESLAAMAAAAPEKNFLGIEVHRPGVGHLLNRLAELKLTNVRVIEADASEVFAQRIAPDLLAGVQLFFPDPWPKKRHHKRRLLQPAFAELVRTRLAIGGIFHMATDWQDYAQQMMEVMSAAPGYENVAGIGAYGGRGDRPLTKFEQRGERLGHGVWDLRFRRTA
jgi:tRNA (guanine-N7-)-methyltransferase